MSSKLIHDYFNNNIIYYKVILVVLFVSFYEMTSLACLTLSVFCRCHVYMYHVAVLLQN